MFKIADQILENEHFFAEFSVLVQLEIKVHICNQRDCLNIKTIHTFNVFVRIL